jgi:4-amino-4-deoxy-L-arabinose transferase-like glycosyltransferase
MWSSPEAKPTWDPRFAAAGRAVAERLSNTNGGGPTDAAGYPPLYYATAAPAYLASVGGDPFDRMNAVQLWGVLLLLASATGAWLLAGEVLGRRRSLQLVAAAVVGLAPMSTFISTSVSPDALLITLWTFILWSGARVIRRGAATVDVWALCWLTAAAILTKPTSYALIPAVGLALALGWRRRQVRDLGAAARVIGRSLAISALPVIAWVVIRKFQNHPVLSAQPSVAALAQAPGSYLVNLFDYLWQFYLPRLPGQAVFHVPKLRLLPWPRLDPGLPVWNLWIREGWGAFGWIDVYIPAWVYVVLASATTVLAVCGAAILVRFRRAAPWALLAFFGVLLLSVLAVLHVIEYQSLRGGRGAFIQGRYLLPLIAMFGLAVAAAVSRIPARARGPVVAVLMVGLLALQVIALGTIARTYYT